MPAINDRLTNLRAAASRRPVLTEALAVALLTVAAAVLRLVMPVSFPPGLHGDEAWVGLEAQRILDEGWIGVWTPVAWGQPSGPFYWVAAVFSIFPDNAATLRAALAVLGIATIPAFYLFARTYFGLRPALMGAALLTFSHWHIHYSRTAYPLISSPLVECIVLVLMGIGLKRQRMPWLIAAGIVAGAGVYTYRSYLLFATVLAVVWLFVLVRRPYPLRRLAVHAAAFALPALLIAAPMFMHIANHYEDYTGYGRIASLTGNGELESAADEGRLVPFITEQALRAAGTLYRGGVVDHSDGMGGVSLLGPVAMALFTIGLVIALFRWKDWRHFLLLVGLAAGLAAVAGTVEWGENRRGVIALPMVFAAAGLGGDFLWRMAVRWWPRTVLHTRRVAALRAATAAALVAVVAWNVHTYFWDETSHPTMRSAYAYDLSVAADYLRSVEGDPYVYFYSDRWSWDYEARRFNAPGFEGEDRSSPFGIFKLVRDHTGKVIYVVMPPHTEHVKEIMERYPGGTETEVMDGDRLIFTVYTLDALDSRGGVASPGQPGE